MVNLLLFFTVWLKMLGSGIQCSNDGGEDRRDLYNYIQPTTVSLCQRSTQNAKQLQERKKNHCPIDQFVGKKPKVEEEISWEIVSTTLYYSITVSSQEELR
mmetsp:Transcript_19171/g.28186  ORF Transcript_19171/g.28186 Transcript_19171/m.28186 type:complete len:101 (+) Transcript_19171:447-749(+)